MFTSLSSISNAQVYLNSSTAWKERNGGGGAGNPWFSTNDYTITLPGDTVINGITYFKVLMKGTRITKDWVADTLIEVEPINEFLRPIREEDGKFYAWHSDIGQDILFQDFNLEVGDTTYYDCFGTPEVVDHIDTVYVGSELRKRFHFSPSPGFASYSLIEGIGSTRGLFEHACDGFVFFEAFYTLQCFTKDGHNLAVDPDFPCGTTGVDDPVYRNQWIKASPNPCLDYVQVEFDSHSTSIDLHIISLDGKVVWSKNINHHPLKLEIHVEPLSAGVYVVMLVTANEVLTQKFIKQ